MEVALIFAGVTAFLSLLAAVIIVSIRKSKQRIEDLKEQARRLNLTFSEEGDEHERLTHFHLFKQGHSRKTRNVMRGKTTDLDILIFDYRYTVGGGKNSSTIALTVVVFETRQERLPAFSLRPEHVFHKIGQVLGYHDIDFESHPDFSKRYLLRGEDENAIRSAFGSHVLNYFEQNPGACVEAAGGQLVYYPTRKRVKPEELEALLQEAVRVYALFTA